MAPPTGSPSVLAKFRASLAVQSIRRKTTLGFLTGAIVAALLNKLYVMWLHLRRRKAENLWQQHHDLGVVQACILSTEHLHSLGRVEKRTLFVKPISEVFNNEYIVSKLLDAAEQAVVSKDPVLMTKMTMEDKWHVLNTCTNYISSFFAPYHIFFNEARRVKSYYKSAWYCFTLTCAQTESGGRWFITPHHPVGPGDCGSLRIRIVLMNEQELRDIACGNLEAPPNLFNGRHESRWATCQRFAELFNRQVNRLTGGIDVAIDESGPVSPGAVATDVWQMAGQRWEDWGKHLTRRLAAGVGLTPRGHSQEEEEENAASPHSASSSAEQPEDNAILRIHIPFPSRATVTKADLREQQLEEENVTKDIVLYE